MSNIIYVDVLLVVNFLVNYFLLLGVGCILSLKRNSPRLLLAALIGALASLSIFIPPGKMMLLWAIRIGGGMAMVWVAFPYRGLKNLVVRTFSLFVVSFIFSGIMLALWFFTPIKNMHYYNGIVYFHIKPTLLFTLTILCYLVLSLFQRIYQKRTAIPTTYRVQITRNSHTICLQGVVDTGNSLREPFTGCPVAVCSSVHLKPLFTDLEYHSLMCADTDLCCSMGFRIIPYHVVNASGFLIGFVPDSVTLYKEEMGYAVDRIYIGISENDIHSSGCEILLPRELQMEAISAVVTAVQKNSTSYGKD